MKLNYELPGKHPHHEYMAMGKQIIDHIAGLYGKPVKLSMLDEVSRYELSAHDDDTLVVRVTLPKTEMHNISIESLIPFTSESIDVVLE
jgi:hypothetical protein